MSETVALGRVIVAGSFRAKRGVTLPVLAAMAAMSSASRAEEGCESYHYSIDAFEPTIIRVFEVWADISALRRHRDSNHLKLWRSKWNELGLCDADLTTYGINFEVPL